jgi:hypothetical protein
VKNGMSAHFSAKVTRFIYPRKHRLINVFIIAKLKQLTKYCHPKKKAEMLFFAAESSPTMKAQAVEHETEINRKWNLLYVSLRIKTDAVFDRKEVLKRNPNLARRALFGVVMRTEIMNFR